MPTFLGSDSVLLNSSTPNFSYTCHTGSNRKLIVGVCVEVIGGANVNSVTYNGINLQKYVEFDGGTHNCIAIFYLDEANYPSVGGHTLQANLSQTGAPAMILVSEWSDAWQGDFPGTTPSDKYNYVVNASVNNNNFSTEYDNSYIIGWCCGGGTTTYSAQSSQAQRESESGGTGGASSTLGDELITTAGTTAMNWTCDPALNRFMSLCVELPPYSAMPQTEDNAPLIGLAF